MPQACRSSVAQFAVQTRIEEKVYALTESIDIGNYMPQEALHPCAIA